MTKAQYEVPKGQPLRWKDSEPGAAERTDVPDEIKTMYKFYYRDEKGNEFCVAKDYEMPVDVVCQIRFGMNLEELTRHILNKYYERYEKKVSS